MIGVRSAAGRFGFVAYCSPTLPFSARRVDAASDSSTNRILPEPEVRNGLSLSYNDAFATIARSMFLACLFASRTENLPESVRSEAPPLRIGFEADAGRYPRL
jgi:hypothetical protein